VRAPPTTGAPPRRRWSGMAQRGNRLLRRGAGRHLRWVLAHGRCWVRVWLRPEPVPKIGQHHHASHIPHLTGVQIAFFHVGAEETKDLAMYCIFKRHFRM
jgi:hypothetical protein